MKGPVAQMKAPAQLPRALWAAALLSAGLLLAVHTSLRVGRTVSTVYEDVAPCSGPSADRLLRKMRLEVDKLNVEMNEEQKYLLDSLYVQAHVNSDTFQR
jgi:hypothetical protein